MLPLLASCGMRIPSAPMAAHDGDVLARDERFSIAIVADWSEGGPALHDAIRAAPPDLLVLAGNAVARSRTEEWIALFDSVDGLAVVPLPGDGERRGDRSLDRFLGSWQGLGVEGVEEPVSWRTFVVSTPPARWRFVVLDADRARLGRRWGNQLHWVPKAATAGSEPLVVLLAQPPHALTTGRDEDARELVDLLRHHTDPSRLVLIAAGGAGAAELVLPGGRWGEAWIATGPVVPPVSPLPRRAHDLTLAAPADAALTAWFGAGLDEAEREALAAASAFDARWPVAGFWWVSVDGASVALELRLHQDGGWVTVPVTRWSAEQGWSSAEENPALGSDWRLR